MISRFSVARLATGGRTQIARLAIVVRTPLARLAGAAAVLVGAAAILYGCAGAPAHGDDAALNARTVEMMKASFKAHGQAGLDRLDQDDTQKLCSKYSTTPPPEAVAKRI
ncbi:MAG: hypothetical protein ACREX6_11530, partial [Casimicrobiaceae bacterium]